MSVEVSIIDGPLQPRQAALAAGAGALICFEGVVRPSEEGRAIRALEYEVYEPMAQRMIARLAGQAAQEFGLLAVQVEHSRGRVPVGACAFRLCMAAQHRAEGLAAMAHFIDELKRDVPIWMRPVFAASTEAPI